VSDSRLQRSGALASRAVAERNFAVPTVAPNPRVAFARGASGLLARYLGRAPVLLALYLCCAPMVPMVPRRCRDGR
jgi:hypothetical protein